MATVNRNDPCPCESGRRYKDCHGSVEGHGWQSVPALMCAALDAQKAGLTAKAAALYARVLSMDPANFDATHMLGVAQYQRGRFDEALVLLRRAKQIDPANPAALQNLRLLEAVAGNEAELCRDAVARARRLTFAIDDLARFIDDAEPAHCIVSNDFSAQERSAVQPLLERIASNGQPLWTAREAALKLRGARVLDARNGVYPRDGTLIFCGAAHGSLSWLTHAAPSATMLLMVRDAPGMLLDALRALSGEGRRPVALVYASQALASRYGLPGNVLPKRLGRAERPLNVA
jgi:tetratricopeptide (TPR) repeat protein